MTYPAMTLVLFPGPDLYSTIEAFCRMKESIEDRPQEGYQLEFKRQWNQGALRDVAGFANTFGGILIVGVEEESAKPKSIVGEQSKGEFKTRIASSIASNISPTPQYDIGECALPSDPEKRLCVIRVRKGTQLHLLTNTEQSNPVYVRNATEARPAQSAELRALIEQRSTAPGTNQGSQGRIAEWQSFNIEDKQNPQPQLGFSALKYFKAVVLPAGRGPVTLDQALETEFQAIVRRRYPGVRAPWAAPSVIDFGDDRDRDWYQLTWLHTSLSYERRWRVNSLGDLGFATQARYALDGSNYRWSLYDIALGLASTLVAAKDWWGAFNFFGEARLMAWLDVDGLELHSNSSQKYPPGFVPLFYDRDRWFATGVLSAMASNARRYPFAERDVSLPPDLVSMSKAQSNGSAVAEVEVNYGSLSDELPEVVALALNQLVRHLKYSANLARLRQEAASLVSKLDQ